MYARDENGTIKVYKNLPSTLNTDEGLVVNFEKSSLAALEEKGFFPFVNKGFDKDLQYLGSTYFDATKKVFTRDIIEMDTSAFDLVELKAELISQLKQKSRVLLAPTDWQVLRKYERDIQIDADVITARADIILKCDAKEIEVEASTTYPQLIKYDLSFEIKTETE